jgi:hypothetical protein
VNEVLRAAVEVQRFCEGRDWKFCVIGGIAVQRWADPRQTEDADLTILTGFGAEEAFVDALLGSFRAREAGEREKAVLRRVVLLYSAESVGLDVALGALPFEKRCIERASDWLISSELSLRTCSAEDLIVHKAFAARDLDWADVQSVVMRQGRKLKIEQVWAELRPLVALKEEPEILGKLQRIFDQHLA